MYSTFMMTLPSTLANHHQLIYPGKSRSADLVCAEIGSSSVEQVMHAPGLLVCMINRQTWMQMKEDRQQSMMHTTI